MDMEVVEKNDIVLSITLSKPRQIKWIQGGSAIPDDHRFKVVVSDDGLQSTLHLNCATLEDNCEFMAEVDDLEYGFTTSSCLVSVKGTLNCI